MMKYLCLFVALLVFVPTSYALQCWSHFCERGPFCIETCSSNLTSCVASYYRMENGTTIPTYFACSTTSGGLCLQSECTPSPNPGNIYSCCCRGDLCNAVPGITPGTSTLPTVPPVPEGYIVCEAYNCSTGSGTCYHGYQSCAEAPTATAHNTPHHHYCQTTYRKNDNGLYELYHKGCLIGDDPATQQRCTGKCSIDTESGDPALNCCCDDFLCNVNVTATNPSLLVGREPDECARMGCDHSCILHDGNPTCLCRAGYSLSQDRKSCEGYDCLQYAKRKDTPRPVCDINVYLHIDECLSSPCNVTCVNTEGSFHCECPLGKRLAADGSSCDETGLVCQYHECNRGSCAEPGIQYCDDQDPAIERSRQICQATYTRVGDGSFRPGLLSCFSGNHGCGTDKCVLRQLERNGNVDIYFCCCTGDLCNVQIVFPNGTQTTSAPTSSPTSTTSVTVNRTEPPTPTTSRLPNDTTTDKSVIPSGTTGQPPNPATLAFAIAVVILVVVIALVVVCVYCAYRKRGKKLRNLQPSRQPDNEALFIPADNSKLDLDLDQVIGHGRYADVWKGKLKDGRLVAVKDFKSNAKDSMKREYDIYCTPDFQHRNVLLFIGCGRDPDKLRLIVEYHPNGSLYDMLRNETISLAEFCVLAETAALGIAHLHSEKIVDGGTWKPAIAHRDLKSKNILISLDRQCVISDFGLAWKFKPGESPMEAQGQVGTTRYMAPEVLEGAINFQRESFLRIDIYALALITWEMASRTVVNGVAPQEYRPPFEDLVSPNPSLDEMRSVVVQSQMRPKIPKAFINADMDTIPQTIEEAWDQDSEARLSAQCIAERIRSFRQSKAGASFKDSGYLGSATNNESLDSTQSPYTPQPQTPSYCSSMTMSPLEMKPTENMLPLPHPLTLQDNEKRTSDLGNTLNQQRMSVSQFDIQQQHSRAPRAPPQAHKKNSAIMYNIHSTETTV